MTDKKRNISAIQITTFILIVIYILWEKNVQQHLSSNLEDADLSRIDLWFIFPVLVIMIAISIWQFFKK